MAALEFSDILLEGLAPDGGLAVPEQLPQVSAETLESWRGLPYADLAFEVLSRFATDIPADDLRRLTRAAYTQETFNSEDIVPLRPLDGGLSLLGLSEGPTLAFKDMAMQFLGQVFEYVLSKRGTTLNIVGATSGDTGSAAEYALRGKRGVSVFMLSPYGRMSAFQRAQMYSLQDENIHNIAVRGVFDEAQDIVKALAGDLSFKTKYRLGAVNSINWARISAQVVYYFHGWLRATEKAGPAGVVRRALGQLQQHPVGPHRPQHGPAHPQAGAGHQRKQRAGRVLPHRRVPSAPRGADLRHVQPVHGHFPRLQLRALCV